MGSTPARAKVWKRARSQTQLVGLLLAHDQRGRGAVGDLRGRAGGDLAVGLERRLQSGQRLHRRAGADALVTCDELAGLDQVAGLLVEPLLHHTDDLVVEASLLGGLQRPALGLHAEGVEVLAADAPLVGDHLGADALGDETACRGVALNDLGAERERTGGDRGAHRRGGHDLDAGGDHDVVGTGDDTLGGEVGRLLRRAALAVDRGGRDLLRPACGEDGVAADVEALATDLHDAAHDHVLDERGI